MLILRVKFINLSLYIRILCGLVKIFPYLRTWKCVPKSSFNAEERIKFWVIIFSCQTPDCCNSVHGTMLRFSQIICLLNKLGFHHCEVSAWSKSSFTRIATFGRPWTPTLQLWVSQKRTSTYQMTLPNWQTPHLSQYRSSSISPFYSTFILKHRRFLNYFSFKKQYRMLWETIEKDPNGGQGVDY